MSRAVFISFLFIFYPVANFFDFGLSIVGCFQEELCIHLS